MKLKGLAKKKKVFFGTRRPNPWSTVDHLCQFLCPGNIFGVFRNYSRKTVLNKWAGVIGQVLEPLSNSLPELFNLWTENFFINWPMQICAVNLFLGPRNHESKVKANVNILKKKKSRRNKNLSEWDQNEAFYRVSSNRKNFHGPRVAQNFVQFFFLCQSL